MNILKLFGKGAGCAPCVFALQVIEYEAASILFSLDVRIGDIALVISFRSSMVAVRSWKDAISKLAGSSSGEVRINDDDNSLDFVISKLAGNVYVSIDCVSVLPYHLIEGRQGDSEDLRKGSRLQVGHVFVPDALAGIEKFLVEECLGGS